MTGAVIATSLVRSPCSCPWRSSRARQGSLFRQFALTIAFSIAISAFNYNAGAVRALAGPRAHKGPFLHRLRPRRIDDGALAGSLRWRSVARFRDRARLAGLGLSVVAYRMVPRAFVPRRTRVGDAPRAGSGGRLLRYTSGGSRRRRSCRRCRSGRRLRDHGLQLRGHRPQPPLMFFGLKPYSEQRGAAAFRPGGISRIFGPSSRSRTRWYSVRASAREGLGTFGGFSTWWDRGSTLGGPGQGHTGHGGRGNGARTYKPLHGLHRQRSAVRGDDRPRRPGGAGAAQQITDTLQTYMGSAYVNDFDFSNRSTASM